MAVIGSHAKTTTTWMIGHALRKSGHDPVIMVGGRVAELGGTGSRAGDADLAIVELDESDGGFVHVQPTVAVLTNLEAEHARHYGGEAALREAVNGWLQTVPTEGYIICGPNIDAELLQGCQAQVIHGGVSDSWHWQQMTHDGTGSQAELWIDQELRGTCALPMPGAYQMENALLALAAASIIEPDVRPEHLNDCQGVERRFTIRGISNNIRVIEDYAHHPSELQAVIGAAQLNGGAVHALHSAASLYALGGYI